MGNSFLAERIASRQQAFSVGGKIRVGTKAISKKAAANPQALALFQKAERGLISFREAEKEIYKVCEISNPFYPRNTQEFHVHPWDMNTGGMATSRRILELYGEVRGNDKSPKLYRFPVVFPDVQDYDLDTLVGGGLAVQGGGPETVRYSSRYEADGSRVCTHLPEVVRTPESKRKVVQHVPRKPIVRGACVPEECSEYAFGMCKFSGKLRFFIDGIAGAGVFELHTGSTEAAAQIYLRLSQAMQACRGRLPNFTPDGRPVFWISKAKAVRQYFDENQVPKMGEQWVPQLDMEIELPKVLWLRQQAQMLPPSNTGSAVPSAWLSDAGNGASSVVLPIQAANSDNGQSLVIDDGVRAAGGGTANVDKKPEAGELMHGHAKQHQYTSVLQSWGVSRCGEGWQTSPDAVQLWERMHQRFGERTGSWIAFLLKVQKLNMQIEQVRKYMHIKVGPLGSGELLQRYTQALDELCEDGASVATEVMLAALESAGV